MNAVRLAAEAAGWLRSAAVAVGGRPSERHDEQRAAECMTCGRGCRLNPSLPLALQPRCDCRTDGKGEAATLNWRVRLGAGEPDQLICERFPAPVANRDVLRVARPGRGAVAAQALEVLRRGQADGEG